MDRLFDPYAETTPLPPGLRLAFHAHRTVGQLHRFFGIPGPTWSTQPVGMLLEKTPEGQPARLGPFLVTANEDPDYVTLTYAPETAATQEECEHQVGPSTPSGP